MKIVIFGFSANPPSNNHIAIVTKLTQLFERVVIIPRGTNSNKPSTFETTSLQRKEMVKLAFSGLSNTEIDFFDLNTNVFTPTWILDKKYKSKFPDSEIWHVVGGDIVKDGKNGNSQVQRTWNHGEEIWDNLNWAVINHLAFPVEKVDLPSHNVVIKMERFNGRSTDARNRVAAGLQIGDLVPPEIEEYIKENDLYKN